MEPMTMAALIGAGSSLLGGIMGGEAADDAREAAFWQQQQNIALQREFAQHGIRWRVEDAKAAGLHPLYALSGGGAAFAPNPVVVGDESSQIRKSFTDMGQSLSRAIAAQETADQRELGALQRRLLAAQIDNTEAQAQMYRSQASRPGAGQAGVAFPSVGSEAQSMPYIEVEAPNAVMLNPADNYSADYPGKYDLVKAKPVEIESVSKDAPWVTAGPNRPGFQRFRVTRNMEMLLPVNDEGWSEGIESVPMWMWPMVYQANRDFYGPNFWRLFVQEVGANSPVARYLSRIGLDEPSRGFRRGDLGSPRR